MKTSTINLTIVATFGIIFASNTAFAGFPIGGNGGGGKRISIGGNGISIRGGGKHIEMSPGNVSVHGSGKHIEVGNGRISIHGGGQHIEVNRGGYNSCGSSEVVYTAPPVVEVEPAVVTVQPTPEVSVEPDYEVSLEPAGEPEAAPSMPVAPVSYAPQAMPAPQSRYVGYQPRGPVYGPSRNIKPGLEPINSTYVVEPGDTCYEVSLKMYNTSDAAPAIAMFNRIPVQAKIRPGAVVHLPSISADGTMSASQAPPAAVQ